MNRTILSQLLATIILSLKEGKYSLANSLIYTTANNLAKTRSAWLENVVRDLLNANPDLTAMEIEKTFEALDKRMENGIPESFVNLYNRELMK